MAQKVGCMIVKSERVAGNEGGVDEREREKE
jgi:hypothetical protein